MLRRLLRLEVSRSYLSWFSITCLGFSLSSLNLHIICWPRPSSPAVFSASHECLIVSGLIETAVWNPVQSAFSTQCLAFHVSMTLSAPISCSLYSEGAMGTEELLRITLAFFFSLYNTSPQFHIQFQANHSQNLLIFFPLQSCAYFLKV